MRRGWVRAATAHPVITGVLIACTALGVVLGGLTLSEEWSLVRRILAGAVSGAGVGLLMTASRIVG